MEREAVGFGETAVPLKETTRLAPFVPFTARVPVSGPIGTLAEGVNETLYVHALPLATPENPPGWPSVGQVVVAEKLPVVWKLVIWKPVEPVLVKLALCEALEVPINCPPKDRLFGEIFAAEVFTTSYTPRSIVPTMRGLPSKSVVGRLGAALLPALTAGEAACR